MNISVQKQGQDKNKGTATLTIAVPFADQKKYLERAAKALQENKPLKGFRPGTAPFEIVEKQYGGQTILEASIQEIVSESYYTALEKEELRVVGQPEIAITKQAFGNDVEFTATVSLLPEVTVADLSSVSVKKQDVKTTDSEVNKALQDLQKMRATEAAVTRAAQKGDMVKVDFEAVLDGVALEGGSAKDYSLILGDKQMIPGFEEQIVGIKSGEKKTFKLAFPKDYKKELANKEAEFTVTVKEVLERTLPELTDEFAKTLGQESVVELKKLVQENIQREAEHKEAQRQELEILDAIVAKSTFGPIPEVLLENEITRMIRELEQDLQYRGVSLEDYMQQLGKTETDLRKDFAERGEQRVKTALVTRKIAEENKIAPAREEVEKEIAQTKLQYKDNPDVQKNIASREYREYVEHVLTNQKVVEYLREKIISD